MKTAKKDPIVRETYRHGDLRRALLDAGIELARTGGPEAVVLREVTRQAGVVPNAAYRHFANRDDLMEAVRHAALAEVARWMEQDLAAVDGSLSAKDFARASLRTVGLGYLRFATAEPGLFRAAFVVTHDQPTVPQIGAGQSGSNPFELLGTALDLMVAAGLLPAERRPGAEFLAWSSVHGLAVLLNDGALSRLDDAQRREVGERLVEMVERGL